MFDFKSIFIVLIKNLSKLVKMITSRILTNVSRVDYPLNIITASITNIGVFVYYIHSKVSFRP